MLWLFLLGTVAGCAAATILAMRYCYGAAALTLARSISMRLKDLERGGREGADAPPAETAGVALLRELAEQARLAKPRGLGGDPWALVGSGLAALAVACFCALALGLGSSILPTGGVGLSSPQDPDVVRLERYAKARVDPPPPAGPMSTPPQLPDVETMIGRLAARLQSQPEDAEGWRMLGWSYFHLGQPLKAIEAYARAVSLQPQSSELKGAYGEALVAADGGSVTPRAAEAFQAALAIDAQNAKARYFLALGKAQAGNKQDALKEYLGLQGELQGDPQQEEAWVSQLREQTERLARELKVDLPPPASLTADQDALPDRHRPTPEEIASIQALPADQQQKMIREMVEGLAKRLRERPIDEEGWVRLIRSRVVLGEQQAAREDLARALAAFAGDAFAGARIAAAAKQLGVAD
jgi:cytochrome c-type biogenesis protein CcmH